MSRQINIRVDAETLAWLEAMAAAGGHRSVSTLAGAIIRDVVADDRAAHAAGEPEEPRARVRRHGLTWWLVGPDGARLAGPFGSRDLAEAAREGGA